MTDAPTYIPLIGHLNRANKEGWGHLIRTKADEKALLEGYSFDWEAANHVTDFFEEFLILPKEQTAFLLLKYQKEEILWPLFGWMRPNGTRRFRRGYIEMPKKQGKTTLGAGIGNYMLFGDGEPGAEVYCCANSQEQATILWSGAAEMVESSPFLDRQCDVVRSRYRIVKDTQSWFAAWSNERSSKDGPNIHCALVDELHEWGGAGREFWKKIRYGGAARRQPLCPLAITTAGSDKFSLCYEQHEYAKKLIDGIIDNDLAFFPLIYAVDEKRMKEEPDYWKTEEAHREANPSYEVILKKEDFEDDVRECENDPAARSMFFRYRLNYWTEADTPWIDLYVWDRNKGSVIEKDLIKKPCSVGLDLASVEDTVCYLLNFPYMTENPNYVEGQELEFGEKMIRKFKVLARIFCPEYRIQERATKLNVRYDLWVDQKILIPTPGETIEKELVFYHLTEDYKRFDIRHLQYDPWGADELLNWIEKKMPALHKNCEAVRQGKFSMSDTIKATYVALKKSRIEHGGNQMLRWMASNAVVKEDGNENYMLVKDRSKDKIDGMIALVLSMKRALTMDLAPKFSVYGSSDFGATMKELKPEAKGPEK